MPFIVLLATMIAGAAVSPAFGTTTADAPKPHASAEASPQMLAFSIHPRMPRPRWP